MKYWCHTLVAVSALSQDVYLVSIVWASSCDWGELTPSKHYASLAAEGFTVYVGH